MTGAEYDSRRRLLGLSVTEAAAFHGVADRSIRYWASGAPPAGAVAELADLAARESAARARLIGAASRYGDGTLYRYAEATALAAVEGDGLPLGCHAMMIARAADDLRALGIDVTIEWG